MDRSKNIGYLCIALAAASVLLGTTFGDSIPYGAIIGWLAGAVLFITALFLMARKKEHRGTENPGDLTN